MPLGSGIRVAPEIIEKTPEEILTKPFSFAGADIPSGSTISSVDSATIVPSGMTLDASSFSGNVVQVTFSSGAVDNTYYLVILVTLSTQQKLLGVGRIRVRPGGN